MSSFLALLTGSSGLLGKTFLRFVSIPLFLLFTYSHKSVLGLIFTEGIHVVVDDAKTGALTSTEGNLETIKDNKSGVGSLVHSSKLFTEFNLGDTGSTLMDDINDLWVSLTRSSLLYIYHLLAAEEFVEHAFTGANSTLLVVGHCMN